MIFYLIPFFILTVLTFLEYSKRFNFLIKNKYFYSLITVFFIIFIGLRYEVGCDWNQYLEMYEKYNSLNFIEIIKTNILSEKKFEELGHIFITLIFNEKKSFVKSGKEFISFHLAEKLVKDGYSVKKIISYDIDNFFEHIHK